MRFSTEAYNILISSLTILALASCGGAKSKSQLATLTVNPSKPVVINADAILDGDEKVTGPWFQFSLRMTNGATEKITIVALTAEIFAQGSSGTTDVKTVAFTPGEFNFTVSETLECKFSTFGTWEAGESKILTLSNGNAACNRTPVFVAGSNSKGPNGNNFRYRVRAKPHGWFGTEDNATDRFEKTVTFFTQ